MIIAEFYADRNESVHYLHVTGHAGAAQYGHDTVCAAASILVYALAASLQNTSQAIDNGEMPVIVMDEGNAKLVSRAKQTSGRYAADAIAYGVALNGFALLSEEYPDYVQVVEKDSIPTRD